MPTSSPYHREPTYHCEPLAKNFAGLSTPATIFCAMLVLLPALGVPSVLMVQDTLKSAIAALLTLACALAFFWQERQRTTPLQWHGLLWLPLLLMFYALGSIVWAHADTAGPAAIRWFIFTWIVWLGLNNFTAKNIPFLVWAIHGGAVAASIWGALQFWFDLQIFPQFAAPASTFVNHNFFAEYIVCALPFSIWALISMRASPWLALASFSVSLNIVALMMTGCRSAAVAAIIIIPVLIVILWRYRHQLAFFSWKKSQQLLVALVLIGGIIGMGSIPSEKLKEGASPLQVGMQRTASISQSLENKESNSMKVRAIMWQATLDMIKAKPLTGIGAGAWEIEIPLYQPSSKMDELDYYAHNEILQLMSEYGLIVGLFFLITLVLYLLATFYRTWQAQGTDLQEAPLRAFALTGLLALLIASSAGFPWHLAGTTTLFAVYLGLLLGSDARLQTPPTTQLTFFKYLPFAKHLPWNPLSAKIALIFIVCALLLAVYITRQTAVIEYNIIKSIQLGSIAEILKRQGQKPPEQQKAAVLENMRQAMAIAPLSRKLADPVAKQLTASGDWENALWITESIAYSRPYSAVIWWRLAHLYNKLGQYDKAMTTVQYALKLKSVMPGLKALEIDLLSQTGKDAEATQLVTSYFDSGSYDADIAQSGYKLGLKQRDWPLAIRALTLRNKGWPQISADGNILLGKVYIEMQDDTKALEAFRAAVAIATEKEKESIRSQVPEPYRNQL